ncbi:enoyl-CoA hydratase/isomerase family protein [Sphingomonas flavalba]|uniref:enoyl-CoA hydratase/isomerase family protein n=1 Tax=Sphingomonas flavalba TaxID=2559804 RepID=UPI0039E00971
MDAHKLHPWMTRADWRSLAPDWLWFDPAEWNAAPVRMPPVPVIAVGAAGDPRSDWADVTVEGPAALPSLTRAIDRAPRTAAIIVHLLRISGAMEPMAALTAESLAFGTLQNGREHLGWLAGRDAPLRPPPAGSLQLRRERRVLTVTLDRPAAGNAIDRVMRDALYDAFALAAFDATIEEIHLQAEGRCFSLGADLAEFGTTRESVDAHLIRMRTLPAWPLLEGGRRLITHVRGACVGAGLELAAFSHRLTAAPNAWFQLPELRMGLLPGFGGTVSLPRRIGRQAACRLILSGRRIGAREALAIGLIDVIVGDPPFDQRQRDGGAV